MYKEYEIYMGSECVGTACVSNEGLFYRIYCLCRLTGTVPCRIVVSGEEKADLGICVPLNGGFGIETRIPMKKVGKGELHFRVLPKHSIKKDLFVALSPDEPFRYIQRLKDAYLLRRNGQVGLSFKDQAPTQQDSDQNP